VGFFGALYRIILSIVRSPEQAADAPSAGQEDLKFDAVYTGKVKKLDQHFVWLDGPGGLTIRVHISEVSNKFVRNLAEVLQVGENVEFMPVAFYPERREYEGSLDLARETRARRSLAHLYAGAIVDLTVVEVHSGEVHVCYQELPGRIPKWELGPQAIDDCRRHVEVGTTLLASITSIEAPEGWREDKRRRCAQFYASVRKLKPDDGPTVKVAFRGTPFSIVARPRVPQEFDPVVGFVFEAWAEGTADSDLVSETGLPLAALASIRALLRRLDLMDQNDQLTHKGLILNDRIRRVRTLKDMDVEGVLVHGVRDGEQLSSHASIVRDRPENVAPPSSTRRGWDDFRLLHGERLSLLPWGEILSVEKVMEFRAALNNSDIYVKVVRGMKSEVLLVREVPYAAVLDYLWNCFETVQRVAPSHSGTFHRGLLSLSLVECTVVAPANPGCASNTRDEMSPIYWEIATNTWWRAGSNKPHIEQGASAPVPAVPPRASENLLLERDTEIRAQRWVVARASSQGIKA
jgi:hypothetical protein